MEMKVIVDDNELSFPSKLAALYFMVFLSGPIGELRVIGPNFRSIDPDGNTLVDAKPTYPELTGKSNDPEQVLYWFENVLKFSTLDEFDRARAFKMCWQNIVNGQWWRGNVSMELKMVYGIEPFLKCDMYW